jgi:hypothetical protein
LPDKLIYDLLQKELVKYQDLIVKPTRRSALLKYPPAWRNPDVSVDFYPDLHNRDGKLLAALNALYSLSRINIVTRREFRFIVMAKPFGEIFYV